MKFIKQNQFIANISKQAVKTFLSVTIICIISTQLLSAKTLSMIDTGAEKNSTSVSEFNELSKTESQIFLTQAKELQILSQIIAKDYFYINQLIREEHAKAELSESIIIMDKAFSALHSGIQDEQMQNMLSYLVDIKEEYKKLLNQPFSSSNGSMILDYSETIFEGSRSLIKYLTKNNSNEVLISDVVFQQQLILQRISKFYIAFQVGFNDPMIVNQLKSAIKQFDQGVKQISHHNHNKELLKEVSIIKKYWPLSRKFYLGMEKGDLTLIVYISTDHMMSSLDKILNSYASI